MPTWWRRRPTRARPSRPDPPVEDDPGVRARWAWDVLVATAMVQRGGAVRVHDAPSTRSPVAALWPLSQVLSAALAIDHLAPDDADQALLAPLAGALDRYRLGEAWATHPGASERYVDDAQWVGLAAVRAARAGAPPPAGTGGDPADWWWAVAERAARFALANQEADGGIRWVEPRPGRRRSPRNACSTAPAVELALAVAERTGAEDVVDAAVRADRWLWATLGSPEGLVWDHQEPDGRIERTIWSYNQGSAVAAAVARWRADGDAVHLDRAEATTAAALDHLARHDRLWRQPPAFDAIFFRGLVVLDAERPQPRARAVLADHAARLWHEALDPATGRFTAGGVGRYDDGGTLDHAAAVQLLALAADPTWWAGSAR